MKRIEEPLRWLDPGSDAPAGVRALIAEGRDALGPTPEELARLGAFVAGAAGAASGGAAGAAKAAVVRHALMKGATMKLVAVLAVGSVGGAVGWSVLRRTEAPPVAPAVHASREAPREARETGGGIPSADVKPPPVESPAASPVGAPPSVASPTARAKGAVTATARAMPTGPIPPSAVQATATTPRTSTPSDGQTATAQSADELGGESELALLDRARTRVASDPAAAMRALDAHRALYPNGTFAQEREVLAIEALVQLGRRHEAEARAAAFESAFPGSAHRRRIAVLLGGDAGP